MGEFTFEQQSQGVSDGTTVRAKGYTDAGSVVAEGVPLMFPPLAAGGHGTPTALANFLFHLSTAYQNPAG